MPIVRGFESLKTLPAEKVTETISRRVLTGEKEMIAGDLGVIPGGVEHEAWFPEDTEVIDIFAPPREDFLTATPPACMRQG